MKINQSMSAFLHILVNYRNDAETAKFLEHCLKLADSEKGTFFIANNSAKNFDDDSFSHFESSPHHQVNVFNYPDNPGYFPAAQRCLQPLKAKNYQFVILSNTDLEILNHNFYSILLGTPPHKELGAIAPSVRSGLSGKECNPLYWTRPSKQKINFLNKIYSDFYIAWVYHLLSFLKTILVTNKKIFSGQSVYAPNGCFLILTGRYFDMGGDFAHGVRLYGEEIVLAEKLRTMGLKVILEPSLRVFHREKGSEIFWWHRLTISRQTFEFKKEAAHLLFNIFH